MQSSRVDDFYQISSRFLSDPFFFVHHVPTSPVNALNRFLEACPEKQLKVKPEYLDLSSHPNHVHRR